jgi:hypothetical protein
MPLIPARGKGIHIEKQHLANKALYIDRKGHGLIASCPFCVSGACCKRGFPLVASELVVIPILFALCGSYGDSAENLNSSQFLKIPGGG